VNDHEIRMLLLTSCRDEPPRPIRDLARGLDPRTVFGL
jgi:hypothetical protein